MIFGHSNQLMLEQPNATASFAQHSLLATITVLRSVIAAAAQVRDSEGLRLACCAQVFLAYCRQNRRCLRQS